MNEVIPMNKVSQNTKAKIAECLRTKVVYVKSISDKQLAALNAKGFTVILK
jgi:hypothetical protein